jgi:hypothetical protein
VFLLEPAMDPAIEQQAVARVHRIGQTRETVVTRLLVDGTVEMEVLRVLQRKQQLFVEHLHHHGTHAEHADGGPPGSQLEGAGGGAGGGGGQAEGEHGHGAGGGEAAGEIDADDADQVRWGRRWWWRCSCETARRCALPGCWQVVGRLRAEPQTPAQVVLALAVNGPSEHSLPA